MKPGFDGSQFVDHLLDRIERNAVGSAKLFRMFQDAHRQRLLLAEQVGHEKNKARQLEVERKLAEAKIAEWQAYGEKMRDLVWTLHTGVNHPNFPDIPAALEYPIPF